jgi:CheY-like chemotaxis protein
MQSTRVRSGHVQKHGVLLALAERDLAVVLASANVAEIVGYDLDRVLGAGIATVLAEPSEKALRELLAASELASANPIEARTHDGRELDAILHRASGLLVIELEPPAGRRVRTGRIDRAIERIQDADDVAQVAVEELKDLVGMAGIALYRASGELVASSGRHPAFVALEPGESMRFIADRAAEAIALVPAGPLAPVALDLAGSVLRAFEASGRGALLAIATGESGVVVCEHPEAMHVEYTARAAAQVIARTLGWLVAGPAERPTPPPSPPDDLTGARILIVDDDTDVADGIAIVLRDVGAITDVAGSAAAAMVAFHRFRPDVVVSDVTLPDKDGFALMRELRSLGPDDGGWIPAIAISGIDDPEHVREAILAGFQLHMPKPIDPADLIARLGRLVGRTVRRT